MISASSDITKRIANGIMIAAATALLWSGAKLANEKFLPFTKYAAGIDIFYLPAGVRVLLLLVGGPAAAAGISIANLFFAQSEFGTSGLVEAASIAVYTGVVPYISLLATLWVLGVDSSLKNIASRHLPWICLGTAVGSSILHNIYFHLVLGTPWSGFPARTLAMAAGDFSGSLLIVLLLWGAIRFYRKLRA